MRHKTERRQNAAEPSVKDKRRKTRKRYSSKHHIEQWRIGWLPERAFSDP